MICKLISMCTTYWINIVPIVSMCAVLNNWIMYLSRLFPSWVVFILAWREKSLHMIIFKVWNVRYISFASNNEIYVYQTEFFRLTFSYLFAAWYGCWDCQVKYLYFPFRVGDCAHVLYMTLLSCHSIQPMFRVC